MLERRKVPYLLIGGLAVAVHTGQPRATVGVGLAVRSDAPPDDLVKALVAAGFELKGRHAHTINHRHGSGAPVQLAFDATFDAAIGRATRGSVRTTSFARVTREDLLAPKERAGRDPARRRSEALRDQADVELLRGDVGDPDEGWWAAPGPARR